MDDKNIDPKISEILKSLQNSSATPLSLRDLIRLGEEICASFQSSIHNESDEAPYPLISEEPSSKQLPQRKVITEDNIDNVFLIPTLNQEKSKHEWKVKENWISLLKGMKTRKQLRAILRAVEYPNPEKFIRNEVMEPSEVQNVITQVVEETMKDENSDLKRKYEAAQKLKERNEEYWNSEDLMKSSTNKSVLDDVYSE